jgi:hypothetical protein
MKKTNGILQSPLPAYYLIVKFGTNVLDIYEYIILAVMIN